MSESAMEERQRQVWLKAMGLTPWVASQPLPGAAPSPVIEVRAPVQPEAEPSPVRAITDNLRKSTPTSTPRVAKREVTTPVNVAAPAPVPGLRFTLYAYDMGSLWLVAQQHQADAPDFSRDELGKLQQLMRVWGGAPLSKRRALVLSERTVKPLDSQTVRETVNHFMKVLARKYPRFLFSASESFNRVLHDQSRFQLIDEEDYQWLVISTLHELIFQPEEHRQLSWDAMNKAGFNAR